MLIMHHLLSKQVCYYVWLFSYWLCSILYWLCVILLALSLVMTGFPGCSEFVCKPSLRASCCHLRAVGSLTASGGWERFESPKLFTGGVQLCGGGWWWVCTAHVSSTINPSFQTFSHFCWFEKLFCRSTLTCVHPNGGCGYRWAYGSSSSPRWTLSVSGRWLSTVLAPNCCKLQQKQPREDRTFWVKLWNFFTKELICTLSLSTCIVSLLVHGHLPHANLYTYRNCLLFGLLNQMANCRRGLYIPTTNF